MVYVWHLFFVLYVPLEYKLSKYCGAAAMLKTCMHDVDTFVHSEECTVLHMPVNATPTLQPSRTSHSSDSFKLEACRLACIEEEFTHPILHTMRQPITDTSILFDLWLVADIAYLCVQV